MALVHNSNRIQADERAFNKALAIRKGGNEARSANREPTTTRSNTTKETINQYTYCTNTQKILYHSIPLGELQLTLPFNPLGRITTYGTNITNHELTSKHEINTNYFTNTKGIHVLPTQSPWES